MFTLHKNCHIFLKIQDLLAVEAGTGCRWPWSSVALAPWFQGEYSRKGSVKEGRRVVGQSVIRHTSSSVHSFIQSFLRLSPGRAPKAAHNQIKYIIKYTYSHKYILTAKQWTAAASKTINPTTLNHLLKLLLQMHYSFSNLRSGKRGGGG